MKMRTQFLTGVAAIFLVGGYFAYRGGQDKTADGNATKEVVVQTNSAPKSIENYVLEENEVTRTNIGNIGTDMVQYAVSPRDPEFRTNILAGVRKYLEPITSAEFRGATIRVPVDLTFPQGSVSNITADIKKDTSIWRFSVEGHSVMYQNSDEGGYPSYFGPLREENIDLMTQSINNTDPDTQMWSSNMLYQIAARPETRRLQLDVVDGLLNSAFNSLPQNGRNYFYVTVKPTSWGIYNFGIYTGEIVEDTSQYRANNRLNPGSVITIMGEGEKQAKLLSFGLTLSDQKRFPNGKGIK